MTVEHLPPAAGSADAEIDNTDHPMRRMTERMAFDGGWDLAAFGEVESLFDSLSAEWETTRNDPTRIDGIDHAVERAGVDLSGRVVELGAGTGFGARRLASLGANPIATDLSSGMLAEAAAAGVERLIRSDAANLPFPDGSIDVLLCLNMILFPAEVDRVLADDGALVWVNSRGEGTPIHLTAEQIDAALPGEWSVVASRVNVGTWAVARRTAQ